VPAAKKFRNTFAPGIGVGALGVDEVIAGLRYGAIRESSLPGEVHGAVAAELARIKRETISPDRALILLLGAMGEVRGRARLQKYAFLADMGLYSKKTRDLFTMYGWKPARFGPHSRILGRYLRRAVDGGLVEAFPTHDPNGKKSTGYRLTGKGRERLQGLEGAFGKDVALIRGILARFQNDSTEDPLAAHVHGAYPEYVARGTVPGRPENSH